ncbi:MAG TPA: glycoside hydrolase family 38 C-terminal domain-containing protein, partial [Egibacteraceae bacterium]|nr:glycoside hydrolase family 38 C-terminal domain-containing protein [Egibacteraceae bacterium]
MRIAAAESTDLFVGAEDDLRQVVRVEVVNDEEAASSPATVAVRGYGLTAPDPATAPGLDPGGRAWVELGVAVSPGVEPGAALPGEVVASGPSGTASAPFTLAVAEPGWRMFMVPHFHYDPVWWNTQSAYTEEWDQLSAAQQWRQRFQGAGMDLVEAHLQMARQDPDYRFVLAELDYLKPYWDVHPEQRDWIRALLREGRLELVGGTYNEANTNLVSAENTARNAVYGVGYQRDVLGGDPHTAWQLDVFGHDPQFPGQMAAAGLTSASFARGPFHEWGPNWSQRMKPELLELHGVGGAPLMQFPSEFEWIAPSGRGLLTCYMANHYSAGWWMDAAATLAEAEAEAYRLFSELKAVAATRNVLLPVGTDYSPPNRWVTEIQRDWNARYVWPRFVCATAADFFDAVRSELRASKRRLTPQTRDMNPIYTGKDVSYIDTKQMHRDAETTLLNAERFATLASLLGGRYPGEAIDKAWRQLLYSAHHDGITGSESDQVYLDLLAGWREAKDLAAEVLDRSLGHIGAHIDTSGAGTAVTAFNPMSWTRTDAARVEVRLDEPAAGVQLLDSDGRPVETCVEGSEPGEDGSLVVRLVFVARDVPGVGYRTYRAVAAPADVADGTWQPSEESWIENERYLLEVDADRGGAMTRLFDKSAGKELLKRGRLGGELLAYDEYPDHPHFAEGPWHLTPTGAVARSGEQVADVRVERCAIGQRIVAELHFGGCRWTTEYTLWEGVDRVEARVRMDGWAGQDTLFRVRVAADVEGGMPISEAASSVVGRGFALPNVDVAEA